MHRYRFFARKLFSPEESIDVSSDYRKPKGYVTGLHVSNKHLVISL